MFGPGNSQQRKIQSQNMTSVGSANFESKNITSKMVTAAGGGGKIRMASMQDFRQKMHTVPELSAPSNQNQEFAPTQHSSEHRLQDVMLQRMQALEDCKNPPAPSKHRVKASPQHATPAAAADPARDILEELIELKLRVANQQSVIDTLSSRTRLMSPKLEQRPLTERRNVSWNVSDRETETVDDEVRDLKRENRKLQGERDRAVAELGERTHKLTRENIELQREHGREVTELEDENDHLRNMLQGQNVDLRKKNSKHELELLQGTIEDLRTENLKYQRELELMKNSMKNSMTSANGIQRESSVSSIIASRRLKRQNSTAGMSTSVNEAFTLARPRAVKPIPRSSSLGWY